MTSTTFVDQITVVNAAWLNDVNNAVYNGLATPPGGSAQTPTDVLRNLGVDYASVWNFLTSAQKTAVMAGNFTVDTSSAFIAAIATGKVVFVPNEAGWVYGLANTVTIPGNTTILGNNSTIRQVAGTTTDMFTVTPATFNVFIHDLHLLGLSGAGTSRGLVFGVNCADFRVQNCLIGGMRGNALHISQGCATFHLIGNTCSANQGIGIFIDQCHQYFVTNNGCDQNSAGITFNQVNTQAVIDSNNCSVSSTSNYVGLAMGQSQILLQGNVSGTATNNGFNFAGGGFIFANNQIDNSVREGIFVDSTGAFNQVEITGNRVTTGINSLAPFDAIRVLNGKVVTLSNNIINASKNNGILLTAPIEATINNNTVRNSTLHGISVTGGSLVSTNGNVVDGNTGSGISITSTTYSAATGNVSQLNGINGINATSCTNISLTGNTIRSNGTNGIDLTGVTTSTVTGNTILNNVNGLFTDNLQATVISGNTITTNTGYGIRGTNLAFTPAGTDATSCVIVGNNVSLNTLGGIRSISNTCRVQANNAQDSLVVPPSLVIASAAAITLPIDGDFFVISGVTNITSIANTQWIGRTVTLQFQGILTFTDGSNLKLAGNFVTTADDTITLKCDGTNWIEMSRSVN